MMRKLTLPSTYLWSSWQTPFLIVAYFGLETSAKPGFTLPSMQPPKKEPKEVPPPPKENPPGTGGAGNDEETVDIAEDIKSNKELFAELLGSKKARGQDISDMLLSFAGKALAPEATVKSVAATELIMY